MPPQDRVRCDDARDLTQDLPTQPMPTDRQPASIVIGELEPLSTQLASKDPIFFHQIRDRLALLAIQPASQDGQHHLESGRVDHGRSLYHGPQVLPMSVDPVMGHYGQEKGNVREGELHTDRGRSIFGDGHLPSSVDPVMGHFTVDNTEQRSEENLPESAALVRKLMSERGMDSEQDLKLGIWD